MKKTGKWRLRKEGLLKSKWNNSYKERKFAAKVTIDLELKLRKRKFGFHFHNHQDVKQNDDRTGENVNGGSDDEYGVKIWRKIRGIDKKKWESTTQQCAVAHIHLFLNQPVLHVVQIMIV